MKRLRPAWNQNEAKKKASGQPHRLRGAEYHLLALLLYYRVYTTYTFLGWIFGVDETTILRAVRRIEPMLAKITAIKKDRTLTETQLEAIIVDATEQPIERPRRGQRKYYSGKKKRHTIKTEIQITPDGKILCVSSPYPGRVHDFDIRRQERPIPPDTWFLGDSGYQGNQKLHPKTLIPFKRKRNRSLTKVERIFNKMLSQSRILVENIIRKLKIFQILIQRYRNHRPFGKLRVFDKGYGIKMQIIAGLVNFKAGF